MSVTTIGMLIGGLGLFLIAINMISDGLKMAAGRALRNMLVRSTETPTKGIVTGITITAIVQSSSAVTVATIGFVNAGLLTLYQSLGVIYGANIGTTMTGWLVAIIGFKINVEAFALPLIGIGMLLKLIRPSTRWGYIGSAIAGFGLFFIGIDVLKSAFEGAANTINIEQYALSGVSGALIYTGIGFLMTVLTQSSSAAIAIILTAATGGVIGLESAAAMVVGANVGTTSTAGLAVIGATPNAKRVATAHVIFNFLTGLVALSALPVLFTLINIAGSTLGMEDNPAVTLALFHTVFNLLGVLLMWPLTSKLSLFLQKKFTSTEEIDSKPRYIDNTVLASPLLALNAVSLEINNVAGITFDMAKMAISKPEENYNLIETKFSAVENLSRSINEFTVNMGQTSLPENISEVLPKILYALQSFTTISELAFNYSRHHTELDKIKDTDLHNSLSDYKSAALSLIETASQLDIQDLENQQLNYNKLYHSIRNEILLAATQQRFNVELIGLLIDQVYRLDRIIRQISRGRRRLSKLNLNVTTPSEKVYSDEQLDDLSDTSD